jgi:hypothetical protein
VRANPFGHWPTDDGPPTSGEAALSDDTALSADDGATRADVVGLQEQLKAVTAERDRNAYEKSEIIAKANAFSKERDDLRERLTAVVTERERLVAEKANALSKVEEAGRQADAAAVEIARLGRMIDAAPSMDPAVLLWELASRKTRAAVAWVRAKIPEGHPALPWFDRTVETVTKVGCIAVKTADSFVRWAIPKLVELGKRLKSEVEARLAKK